MSPRGAGPLDGGRRRAPWEASVNFKMLEGRAALTSPGLWPKRGLVCRFPCGASGVTPLGAGGAPASHLALPPPPGRDRFPTCPPPAVGTNIGLGQVEQRPRGSKAGGHRARGTPGRPLLPLPEKMLLSLFSPPVSSSLSSTLSSLPSAFWPCASTLILPHLYSLYPLCHAKPKESDGTGHSLPSAEHPSWRDPSRQVVQEAPGLSPDLATSGFVST